MEAKHAVNQYSALVSKSPLEVSNKFTVNLSAGTTPFSATFDGVVHQSTFYKVLIAKVSINHCWYRPKLKEFQKLEFSVKIHVLSGGLILGSFGKTKHLIDDIDPDIKYADFQLWIRETYGVFLKDLAPTWRASMQKHQVEQQTSQAEAAYRTALLNEARWHAGAGDAYCSMPMSADDEFYVYGYRSVQIEREAKLVE